MDWKAVESNEQDLRDGIAEAMADGSESALSWAASAELQLVLMRPFITWLAKNRENGKRTTGAIILNLASMLAETAENTVWIDEEGHRHEPEETLILLAKRLCNQALDLLRNARGNEAGEDTGVKFGVPIDLGGRADA
jgi:hypothetical protein